MPTYFVNRVEVQKLLVTYAVTADSPEEAVRKLEEGGKADYKHYEEVLGIIDLETPHIREGVKLN